MRQVLKNLKQFKINFINNYYDSIKDGRHI